MNIRQLFLMIVFLIVLGFDRVLAQENIFYIKKGVFTNIVGVSPTTNHGDDIVNVNVFYKMGEKAVWGTAQTIISYRYLGVDNQNNLHLQRVESRENSPSDICNLVFALDSSKIGNITLIGERSQKSPLRIMIHVEATNNFVKTSYLGDLPLYKE